MLLITVFILVGFALLLWGADRFVVGASTAAVRLGVSPLLVGLTIVGFATSAPEVLVSATAAWQGGLGMAVGNALGSNIANIGLVLGVTALLRPISLDLDTTVKREKPLLIAVTGLCILPVLDNQLTRLEGIILLIALVAFIVWAVRVGQQEGGQEEPDEIQGDMSLGRALVWLAIGLIALVAGSQLLVSGASDLARIMGISEVVIGATIIAVGTSLPELVISLVSVFRNQPGLAIGNIIGSNIFNLLAVIGVAGAIGPGALDPSIVGFHYPYMIMMTLLLAAMTYATFMRGNIGRVGGSLLLLGFVGYHGTLVILQ